MKKWMLGAMAMSLAACGQGAGAGTGGNPQASSCAAAVPNSIGDMVSVQSSQDPFEAYGKVLLDRAGKSAKRDNYDQLTPEDLASLSDVAPYLKGLSANGGFKIGAGTKLTVTIKENCSSNGLITSSVRASNLEDERLQTPSGVRSYTWATSAEMSSGELERMAEGDACVVGVSDFTESKVTAFFADPMVAEQGHLAMMEAPAGFNLIDSAGFAKPITIAVIDTGIDMNHEDLKDVLWKNEDEIPGNNVDDDKNGYVDDVNGYNFASKRSSPQAISSWSGYQHGTHVAGLAAAQGNNGKGISGVMASGARIMMLNVFGGSSGAASSNVVNAIRYAADNGADVLNMSIGGSGRNAAYEAAIGYAVSKGVTVLAAAGNERSELGPSYALSPAIFGEKINGMITIGSVDSKDLSISTFSNYSPTTVELGAPGSEESSERYGVLSTWPGSKYSRIQGTSMASPVAAGGAALTISMLRARGYDPSPATVEGIMASATSKLDALRAKIRDGRVMNLKLLAEYINTNYPVGGTASGGDPGLPGASSISCEPSRNL